MTRSCSTVVSSFLLALGLSVLPPFVLPGAAQTLTERLKQETPAELAEAARREGDAIRGAVIFARSDQGCAGCHSSGGVDQVGPDLSRLPSDRTDEGLIESILEPSRILREGFATTIVTTIDGNSIAIRTVAKDDARLVGREIAPPYRRREFLAAEIEAIETSSVSSMPDSLPNALKNRGEFLDLVRYLIELRDRSAANDVAERSEPLRREIDRTTLGLNLIDRLGCRSCHTIEAWERYAVGAITADRAPRLEQVAHRVDRSWLESFLLAPESTQPGTAMPDLLKGLADDERESAVDDLVSFLIAQGDRPFRRDPVDAEAAHRGEEIFALVGCVACHAPRDAMGRELPTPDSVPLGSIAPKYSIESLTEFLEHPHEVRPAGRMPDLQLDHFEASAIANYLLQEQQPADLAGAEIDRAAVARGEARFRSLGCSRCHDLIPAEPAPPIPIERIDRGCLGGEGGPWPHYTLSDDERVLIAEVLTSEADEPSKSRRIEFAMATLGCLACHERDGLGGVTSARDHFFQTSDINLGPQGRLPPSLTNVGDKLRPEWLRQVLVGGRSIRPYMATRMPRFGAENVEGLLTLFAEVDDRPARERSTPQDESETRRVGHELAGNTGLNCIACHTFRLEPSETMSAVDLTEMAERLQRDWFEEFLKAPQRFHPNTVMPSFWPGGRAIRTEILDGDTDRQIEALWVYLDEGRQANPPRGQKREPLRLTAGDVAVMLRRSYPDVGKRGIGVGLPSGINYVWDAEGMRLALLWHGDFADPAGVWLGQGHGSVRPLGTEVVKLPAGPELQYARRPWQPEQGRPSEPRFDGYTLDAERRPTFRYAVSELEVTDSIRESMRPDGRVGLTRTLTFSGTLPDEPLTFRLAVGTNIEPVDGEGFAIDDRWRVSVVEGPEVERTTDGDAISLRLTVDRAALERPWIIDYDW